MFSDIKIVKPFYCIGHFDSPFNFHSSEYKNTNSISFMPPFSSKMPFELAILFGKSLY